MKLNVLILDMKVSDKFSISTSLRTVLLAIYSCVYVMSSYASYNDIDTLRIIFECNTETKKAKICKVYTEAKSVSVPQSVVDKQGEVFDVAYFGKMPFADVQESIVSIEFPGTIDNFGMAFMQNCVELEKVYVTDTIVQIPICAFRGCVKLKHVDVKGVNYIGEAAFKGCHSLRDLSFMESVKEIGSISFADCHSIEIIDMSNCLYVIGPGAFMNCFNLNHIHFSKSLEVIKQNTFKNCIDLREIYLPENIKRVYTSAFEGCVNLKKVVVSKFTQIDESAFPKGIVIEYY